MILRENKNSQTSSNSDPKIKSALLDKYEKENTEANQKEVDGYERIKTKESDKLPRPTGWRLVVLPFKMKEKTKGGLYIGQETIERQQIGFYMWTCSCYGTTLL
jgi:hypothetical protein